MIEVHSQDVQIHKIAGVSAIFIAIVMTLGSYLYRIDTLEQFADTPINFLKTVSHILGMSWLFFLLLEQILIWFYGYEISVPTKNEWKWFGGNARTLFLCWGIIFLCWIPCLLAYFPGIFSYDAPAQTMMTEGLLELNDMSPILHTFHIKFCIYLVCTLPV